jgi:predicted aspartyl protease
MTRKIPLYALAALLACLPASARAACQMTKIVEMPVTMDDLVPTVAGEVNGHEAHFIADSGAFFSMLTKTAAKRFEAPLKTGPNNLVVMGAGGMEKMQFTQARDLTLLGHIYHDVDFMVGGDGALGRQVDGLLGQNFFQAADAEFDLADGAIRLFKEQGCEGIAPTYWMAGKPEGIELMRISSASDAKIRGEAWVNGHKIWVMFDTGAGASIRRHRTEASTKLDRPGQKLPTCW